jgi:hypothetical protein
MGFFFKRSSKYYCYVPSSQAKIIFAVTGKGGGGKFIQGNNNSDQ